MMKVRISHGYKLFPGEQLFRDVTVKEMKKGDRVLRAYTEGQAEQEWHPSWERMKIVFGSDPDRVWYDSILYLVARKGSNENEWGEESP